MTELNIQKHERRKCMVSDVALIVRTEQDQICHYGVFTHNIVFNVQLNVRGKRFSSRIANI